MEPITDVEMVKAIVERAVEKGVKFLTSGDPVKVEEIHLHDGEAGSNIDTTTVELYIGFDGESRNSHLISFTDLLFDPLFTKAVYPPKTNLTWTCGVIGEDEKEGKCIAEIDSMDNSECLHLEGDGKKENCADYRGSGTPIDEEFHITVGRQAIYLALSGKPYIKYLYDAMPKDGE